jgi:radical SAM enzyme (TIGR01210 family)
MRAIRARHFKRPREGIDHAKPVIYWEETNFRGAAFDVPLIILRTSPCRWFKAGGCVMCNYELMAIDEGVDDASILRQLEFAIEKLRPISRFNYVFLTSQGSFFDAHEVGGSLRLQLADRLRNEGVRAISTESEAKYCLNTTHILSFRDRVGCPVSIGIGLEACDEFVRNCIINKGLSNDLFHRASASLNRENIGFYTYVTLGKPFLSIEEDIADAVAAVEMSFHAGAFMCVLEMINIQPYTLTDELFRRTQYRPPSLWTGIETLRRISSDLRPRVSLKGVEADIEPVPVELAGSCPLCRERLIAAIRDWNYERRDENLNKVWGSCRCFDDWSKMRAQIPHEDIPARAERALTYLALELAV